jgi:hypothetical protein
LHKKDGKNASNPETVENGGLFFGSPISDLDKALKAHTTSSSCLLIGPMTFFRNCYIQY